jgi:hypothetical protein
VRWAGRRIGRRRVLVTGSGDGGGEHDAVRPALHSLSAPNASAIRDVAIIRLVSTTHAFDMGQRLSTLTFTASGTSLTLTPPEAGRFAPPGPYLLFIVDHNGVPSVAETILLGP